MGALSENTISIVLTKAGTKAVRSGHPWLYSKAVSKANRKPTTGDIAVLYDEKRKFAGIGLYDCESPIAVRVLHWGKPTVLDKNWLKNRISESIKARKQLIDNPDTTGYRLVNGENDQLAGLVADIYDTALVLKLDSACWLPHIEILKNIFIELIKPERIVLRLSRSVKDCSEIPDGTVIYGSKRAEGITFLENGIKFYAAPIDGQKTGFFLDQRENRKKAGELSYGKSVLNVFSYTGGFSVYAAKMGAEEVTSLDISRPALNESIKNFELNNEKTPHHLICGDAFQEMDKLAGDKKKYGVVIVDPPSFARKQSDVQTALKAYRHLNSKAVRLLENDGVLIAASCSARVSSDEFFEEVIKAVKSSGRAFTELERTLHAVDHPIGFPEGAYLKCIYLKII